MISEGAHDLNMWRLMLTVDLLKHGLPDPSSSVFSHTQNSNVGSEKEHKDKVSASEEYMATPIFVHAKVEDPDLVPHNILQLKRAFAQCFKTSSFMGDKVQSEQLLSSVVPDTRNLDVDGEDRRLLFIPNRNKDDSTRGQYESFNLALWKLRDQVLSMNGTSFSRTVSERDWLKNSVKIWELVKSSPIVMEYARTLQSSGMFRR